MTPDARSLDSFGTRRVLETPVEAVTIFDPGRLEAAAGPVERLPYSIRVLLENLLRHEDGETVTREDVARIAAWDGGGGEQEISFRPARVLLQDFTGVPAIVDLAAMRDAMAELGGDPTEINPMLPAELVIDHSVQVDSFGREASFLINAEREFERNRERYAFLRWGQRAFEDFRVVPPDTGIVHQVNLEHLARVVFGPDDAAGADRTGGRGNGGRAPDLPPLAYPDTLVGTDSHTTMINGLGVLGWGVGGIEAEAALLGQPISLLVPEVVGFRLEGELPEGATATDMVLRVTEMLREKGVVGKFVEFFGPGISSLSLADRATIGNMSPEYGATCAIFPVDAETLAYLRFTGRSEDRVALVEAVTRAQGLFYEPGSAEPEYSDTLELDLTEVEPSLAGPTLPQQRIVLSEAKTAFAETLTEMAPDAVPGRDPDAGAGPDAVPGSEDGNATGTGGTPGSEPEAGAGATAVARPPAGVRVRLEAADALGDEPVEFELRHGAVVIAAITSCTNTSNPSVMVGAGLLARNAVERGLSRKPWVKTSLAPGSRVVTEYLDHAGLTPHLEELGFNLVGYGCTTCIGNSGPLPGPISRVVREHDLVVCSVLSGNRNFEGRINPDTRANYLASPPLVVAYALAGRMDVDLVREPLGRASDGTEVYLRDVWPSQVEIRETVRSSVKTEMFRDGYADVFEGDERWTSLPVPEGERFEWDARSTYVRQPPFFTGMGPEPEAPRDVEDARALVVVGDSVTTDHISPAGAIALDSPAARYLRDHDVKPAEFNSYGSRRGNHEVMMRGTFANPRLRNRMVPGREGGYTVHVPSGEETTIFDAATRYREEGTPLIILAGDQYGTGSSRDWAAKGPALLGVRAVIAAGYERIHRSNLIGMGVLPLQFPEGEDRETLGLDGFESYWIEGIAEGLEPGGTVRVVVRRDGDTAGTRDREPGGGRASGGRETDGVAFDARVRVDTGMEMAYYRHGGILRKVIRDLL